MTLDFDPIDEAAANWRGAGWAAVDAMTAATSITRAHQILSGRIDAALAPVGLKSLRHAGYTGKNRWQVPPHCVRWRVDVGWMGGLEHISQGGVAH